MLYPSTVRSRSVVVSRRYTMKIITLLTTLFLTLTSLTAPAASMLVPFELNTALANHLYKLTVTANVWSSPTDLHTCTMSATTRSCKLSLPVGSPGPNQYLWHFQVAGTVSPICKPSKKLKFYYTPLMKSRGCSIVVHASINSSNCLYNVLLSQACSSATH